MIPTGELWEGLSPDEREQVARYCPDRSSPKGSTIFAPGDAPEALYFIGVLSRHLAEMAQDRGQASHKWSFDRLVLTLLKLSKAHGEEEKGSTSIALPLTHQILADMTGTSRETVSRHFARLQREGIVTRRSRTLLIHEARLRALLLD